MQSITLEEKVLVRFATADDLGWILKMHGKMLEKYAPMRRAIELAVQERQLIVPELNGQVIGCLRFEYLGGAVPYIVMLFVHPDEYHDQGVGTAMLEFLQSHLRGLGHRLLLSSSETSEPRPQEWHRKRGFREAGILFGTNDTGAGELFFLKEL
ncbi:GNAT family N-acetyltransferase [candidate division WOR-3 bacterium]|nr:GNAT family N-acetyltransferase [candidate division WOR-3 bacterium]